MKKKRFLKNLFIGLVLFFLYLPILVLVLYSFNTSKLNILFEGFTLKWYRVLLENRSLLEALGNTLFVAVISTLVSTVVGTVSAIALKKYRFFGFFIYYFIVELFIYLKCILTNKRIRIKIKQIGI